MISVTVSAAKHQYAVIETDASYSPDVAQDMVNRALEAMGVGLEFLRPENFLGEEEEADVDD